MNLPYVEENACMFSNKWELMENKEKEIHKERDGERREVLVLIQFQKIR